MKHTVLTDPVSGAEIRPPDAFARLRDRSILDATALLQGALIDVPCPACQTSQSTIAFAKHGFSYRSCDSCGSVYVSPRPSAKALDYYYANAEAARLRVQYFTHASAHARHQHVLQSRVDWIAQMLGHGRKSSGRLFMDFGALHPDLFEEVEQLGVFERLHAVAAPAAVARMLPSDVVCDSLPPATGLAITAFEQLEHQASPQNFIQALSRLLSPQGLLFVTTRTISGFDLQVLWDRTPYVFVPEHLNLLSITGLERLFEGVGLELLELSTPGRLDVDLVRDAVDHDASIALPRLVRTMLDRGDDQLLQDLQGFLQKNRLSSHVRIAARRP